MIDREKVIKGLECHLKELSIGKACNECTYWADNPCEINVIADALALLKEQEEREKRYRSTVEVITRTARGGSSK